VKTHDSIDLLGIDEESSSTKDNKAGDGGGHLRGRAGELCTFLLCVRGLSLVLTL
jgi:hypothetical protein